MSRTTRMSSSASARRSVSGGGTELTSPPYLFLGFSPARQLRRYRDRLLAVLPRRRLVSLRALRPPPRVLSHSRASSCSLPSRLPFLLQTLTDRVAPPRASSCLNTDESSSTTSCHAVKAKAQALGTQYGVSTTPSLPSSATASAASSSTSMSSTSSATSSASSGTVSGAGASRTASASAASASASSSSKPSSGASSLKAGVVGAVVAVAAVAAAMA